MHTSSTAVARVAPSGGGEQLKRHRRGLGPRREQRFGGQTEADEDLLRDVLLVDAGDDPNRTWTTRAFEHVNPQGNRSGPGEDPRQESGPIEAVA
jgi:hypothetical protein